MTETPNEKPETPPFQQADFEKITQTVTAQFQIQESLIEHSIPTYYLKWPQETKQPFLKLLKNLESMNLIALLRKTDGKIVLKVFPKPATKPSNTLINWILFFATIATTFATGYILSLEFVQGGPMSNPVLGGIAFTAAIMAVLGLHEMGHKIAANKRGVDATPPYFIPGPPPIGDILGTGTFGAVIMQKSLPPNKDALFDIGSSGPIISFTVALIVTVIGLSLSPSLPITGNESFIPTPIIFELLWVFALRIPENHYIMLHPIAFAGWVGMIVTMLNLLPAAQLDGGHVARSIFGEKTRTVLTMLSILLLVIEDFWPMAIFVLFISMYKHPGPLDDVSTLSTSRKLLTIFLAAILILCSFPVVPLF
jgi:membrane-associated protease RseP (regulator of RpoE activity)